MSKVEQNFSPTIGNCKKSVSNVTRKLKNEDSHLSKFVFKSLLKK